MAAESMVSVCHFYNTNFHCSLQKPIEFFIVQVVLQLFFLICSAFPAILRLTLPHRSKKYFFACADNLYVHTPKLICAKSFLSGR